MKYNNISKNFNGLFDTLKQDYKKQEQYIIFGTGITGNYLYRYLRKKKYNVVSFVDNFDLHKRRGIKYIYKPEQSIVFFPDAYFILSSIAYQTQMLEQLLLLDIKEEKIICPTQNELDKVYHSCFKHWLLEDRFFFYHNPIPINADYYRKYFFDIIRTLYFKYYNKVTKLSINSLASNPSNWKRVNYRFDVAICAIFKNESTYLKEWIEYHKLVGVQHFYLYNNLSEDNYKDVLQEYINCNIVTLVDWPYPQGQIDAYKDCIQNYSKESRWIGFIDLDEFVVPLTEKNIYDFLRKYNKNAGSILIYWKIFGSSGLRQRDLRKPVIKEFSKCWRKHSGIGKCFYNTSYPLADNNTLLHHELWTINGSIALPPINVFQKICSYNSKQRKGIFKKWPIQINHYATKSYKEYQNKMKGTDVFFEKNPHTDEMFYFHDEKCSAIDKSIYKYLPALQKRLD